MDAALRIRSARAPYRRAGLLFSTAGVWEVPAALTFADGVRLIGDPVLDIERNVGTEDKPVWQPIERADRQFAHELVHRHDPSTWEKRVADYAEAKALRQLDEQNTQLENPAANAGTPAGAEDGERTPDGSGAPSAATAGGEGVTVPAGGAGEGGNTPPASTEAQQSTASGQPQVVADQAKAAEPKPRARRAAAQAK